MADLTTPAGLVAFLASTPYAATNAQVLSGGTSGFTYRVTLQTPLETGQTTVVVKHCLGYLSSNAGFMLDVQRMDFEHEAMRMMNTVSFSHSVRVPRVWWYHPETHTLVLEDCAPARTLSAELVECLKRGDHARIEKLGEVLGDFIGKFHAWGAEPAQAPLRARFLENVTSREAVAKIRWQFMQMTASKYGMERAWMADMVEASMQDTRAGGPVIAMADLWFDNILVSESEELGVYIIDWEMARCARPEWDVAHFACAAYSCVHVYPGLGPELMRAFFKAYAAHAQLDLIQMGINAGRDVMSFGVMMPWVRHTDDSVKKPLAEIGLELLEAAHNSNREALRQNPVLCDFV